MTASRFAAILDHELIVFQYEISTTSQLTFFRLIDELLFDVTLNDLFSRTTFELLESLAVILYVYVPTLSLENVSR